MASPPEKFSTSGLWPTVPHFISYSAVEVAAEDRAVSRVTEERRLHGGADEAAGRERRVPERLRRCGGRRYRNRRRRWRSAVATAGGNEREGGQEVIAAVAHVAVPPV